MDVDVLAAHFVDEPCSSPHADAPAVTRVRLTFDSRVPLERFLAGDLPEVALGSPPQRLRGVAVQKLSAHAVRGVVVALVISVPEMRRRLAFH